MKMRKFPNLRLKYVAKRVPPFDISNIQDPYMVLNLVVDRIASEPSV